MGRLMPFVSSRFLRLRFGRALRERRRLPLASPLHCFELGFQILHGGFQVSQPLLQLGVLSAQPLVFSVKVIVDHDLSLSAIPCVRNSPLRR